MTKEQLLKINVVLEDYLNYLYKVNPLLLDNINFFENLFYPFEFECNIKLKFKNISATETFKLVLEFYKKYYKEDIDYIKDLFDKGFFSISYASETTKDSCQYGKFIDFVFYSKTIDLNMVAHELRHLLNSPETRRNCDNDALTEGLSLFDELLFCDFLKDKIGIDEVKNLELFNFYKSYDYMINSYMVLHLLNIKNNYSYLNEKNYIEYFNSTKEEYNSVCSYFLNKYNSYEDITLHTDFFYGFGNFISHYIFNKFKENPEFLNKFKKLNSLVKENKSVSECLNAIDIDITSINIISDLRNVIYEYIKDNIEINKIK